MYCLLYILTLPYSSKQRKKETLPELTTNFQKGDGFGKFNRFRAFLQKYGG